MREKVGPCAWEEIMSPGVDRLGNKGRKLDSVVKKLRWERRRKKWRRERGKHPRDETEGKSTDCESQPVINGEKRDWILSGCRLAKDTPAGEAPRGARTVRGIHCGGIRFFLSRNMVLTLPSYFLKSPPCPLGQWFPDRDAKPWGSSGQTWDQQLSLTPRET